MPTRLPRFRVGLVFGEEKRAYVDEVAKLLAKRFPEEGLLYDEYQPRVFGSPHWQAELAGLCSRECELIMVILSPGSRPQSWCGPAWSEMVDMVASRRPTEVILARFGHITADGFPEGIPWVDLDEVTPEQIVPYIRECRALALLETQGADMQEQVLRGILQAVDESPGPDDQYVSEHLTNLAMHLIEQDRWTEAEPLLLRALQISEACYPADHPAIIGALVNHAFLLTDMYRWAEAVTVLDRVLLLFDTCESADAHSGSLVFHLLGQALAKQGHLEKAESSMRAALQLYETCLDGNHQSIADELGSLALVLRGLAVQNEDLAPCLEAERLLRRAVQMDEARCGPHDAVVVGRLDQLASLFAAMGREEAAIDAMGRIMEIKQANAVGPADSQLARFNSECARMFITMERPAEAEPFLRRALSMDQALYGADHPQVAADANTLAQVVLPTDPAEAEKLMRRALEIDEAHSGPHHPTVALRLGGLGRILHSTGRADEAEPLLARALGIAAACMGSEDSETQMILDDYIDALLALGLDEPQIKQRVRAAEEQGASDMA